jgi:hypothetical protein
VIAPLDWVLTRARVALTGQIGLDHWLLMALRVAEFAVVLDVGRVAMSDSAANLTAFLRHARYLGGHSHDREAAAAAQPGRRSARPVRPACLGR